MTTLILATRNLHKVEEIQDFLGPRSRYLSLRDFTEAPAVEEDQPTFQQNAAKKAGALARWLQHLPGLEFRVPGTNAFVLADDSGLEVDVLNGAPGVQSARFATLPDSASGSPKVTTTNSPDDANNTKLLRLLKDVPLEKRTARFRCVLSLVRVKPAQSAVAGQLFEGTCEGRIQFEAQGQGGFGYDPLFLPLGSAQTFAQLGLETKNKLSHRAKALMKLKAHLDQILK